MGKKKTKQNEVASVNGVKESKEKKMKTDPWTTIEKGPVRTAHQAYFEEPVEKKSATKHFDQFKNKTKRRNDGDLAERVDFHQHDKGKKRKNTEETLGKKKARDDSVFYMYEDEMDSSKVESKRARRKQKGSPREVIIDEVESYTVEEPEETLVLPQQNGFHTRNIRFADLFDHGEDGGQLVDFVNDMEDEDYEDEEVSDEENFEGLEDEELEGEEIDADEMQLDASDIAEIVDEEAYSSPLSEDELEDEELLDEEDDCSTCSEVSGQDASSDEEGNLGGDRVAIVLQKTSKSSPLSFSEFPFSDEDSSVSATRALAWMISSCDVQTFFNDFYQQNCLVVQRNHPNYYGDLFSIQRMAQVLEKNYVEYGVNINVAEYRNNTRITPNGNGRAYPRQIKAHLKQGRSVQLTNPQAFDEHIWYLCEILQEVFGCFVGANTYLTPAGSAGFAPHWDDIDAFLLQVEGRKYWKIYAPECDEDELPRESSGNFSDEDMKSRKPCFEGWLNSGDMLYIPRGFIHQARTDKNVHSLHLTVSTGRKMTWADLMDKLIPEAVTSLASERSKMRRGLPIGLLDMNGVADYKYRMDEYFVEKFVNPLDRHMSMMRNFISDTCLESAVDIMAREFMKTALPPMLTPTERKFHVMGQCGESLLVGTPIQFHPQIHVRLMRRHGQRLIFESEDRCFVAHRINNSRLFEGREEQTIDLDVKFVPAFTTLLDHCPEWTKVEELPELSDAERRSFCQLLYDHGIILAKSIPNKKVKK